jgi:glutamine synthetase
VDSNSALLPESLQEALVCLKEDNVLRNVLGGYVYSKFMEAKMMEWDEYRKKVTPWEINQYLTRF